MLANWQTIAFEDINKSGYLNLGQGYDVYNLALTSGTTTYINAQGGNDQVTLSGSGNSVVHGGTGYDIQSGGSGNDDLFGALGGDDLTGGTGADTFFFGGDSAVDYINDFQVGVDKLLQRRVLRPDVGAGLFLVLDRQCMGRAEGGWPARLRGLQGLGHRRPRDRRSDHRRRTADLRRLPDLSGRDGGAFGILRTRPPARAC